MIRINLLPIKELQAEVTRRRDLVIGSVALGLVAVLLLGTYLFHFYQVMKLEKDLAGLRAEILALNSKVKEVADLQVKIKDLRGKQTIIEELKRKKTGPVRIMASLSRATPASLWLTELRESGGSVTMNGLAVDNETVADFMTSLAASKDFSHIELVETIQGASAGLKKFSIRAAVIYQAADSPAPDAKSNPSTAP